MKQYTLNQGSAPLLISFPHVGTAVPLDLARRFTPVATTFPDTDWYVDRLYDFAIDMGITTLRAARSRYLVDLNRDPESASHYRPRTSAICPTETFDGELLYARGDEPSESEVAERIASSWLPYHNTLRTEIERLRSTHGYALVLDAHSIWSHLPLLFKGELRDINIGTNDGAACALEFALQAVFATAMSGYSVIVDDRFKGGYITRHYGRPDENVHVIQIELNQATYLADNSRVLFDEAKAAKLSRVLTDIVLGLLAWQPAIREPRAI